MKLLTQYFLHLIVVAMTSIGFFKSDINLAPGYQITWETKITDSHSHQKSRQYCTAGGHRVADTRILSKEDTSLSGAFNFVVRIKAVDTTYLDSIEFRDTGIFSMNILSSFSSSYLLPGDSATLTVSATYDTSAIPYYPRHFSADIYARGSDSSFSLLKVGGVVYFTPYNTTEIWDKVDFFNLPRLWKAKEFPEPARTFIPRSAIPVSDRVEPDSTTPSWQLNYLPQFVDKLPYAVEMAALHPDTLAQRLYIDSTTGGMGKRNHRVFIGFIEGALRMAYTNNERQNFPVAGGDARLSGVRVRLREGTNRFSRTLDEDVTDDDGNFNFDYQFRTHRAQIFLWIEVESTNAPFDISVERRVGVGPGVARNFTFPFEIGPVTNQLFNLNNLEIPIDGDEQGAFRALHYATNAYRFMRQSGYNENEMPNGLRVLIYNQLIPLLDVDGQLMDSHYDHDWTTQRPTIFLGDGDEFLENVVYHEFGHHVMWMLQDGFDWFDAAVTRHRWDDGLSLPLAWMEGWGYGFSSMVDHFYREEDGGEWAWCVAVPNRDPNVNGAKQENIEYRRQAKFEGTNGVGSEYYIACALYDLYDGPDKFNVAPTFQAEDYTDNRAVIENDLENPGYLVGQDEVSLPFRRIADCMLDLRESGDFDNFRIGNYFTWLINDARERGEFCLIPRIKHVFDENRICTDVNDWEYQRTGLASGELRVADMPAGIPLWLPISQANLTGRGPLNINTEATRNTWHESDNFTIDAGTNLRFNPVPDVANPQMNMEFDMPMLTIASGATLTLGSEDGSGTCVANLNCGGLIVIQGTLVINDNSILTIRDGAQLVFDPGATLVINDAAQLRFTTEGRLQIRNGANFTFTGGGFIRFENFSWPIESQIIVNPTGTFRIAGNDQNHKILELAGTEGLRVPPQLGLFEIEDGLVHMITSAGVEPRLDIHCAANLENVRVTAFASANKHRGVHLYGQQGVTIHNLKVEDGIHGMYAPIFYGNNKLTMTAFSTERCGTGIYTRGSGVRLNGGVLNSNGNRGWFADVPSLPCFSSGSISNTVNQGIYYSGTSTATLFLQDGVITSGKTGVEAINAPVAARCNQVTGNTVFGYVLRPRSTLYLAPVPAIPLAGHTSVDNFGHSIYANRASDIFLDNGKNNLQPPAAHYSLLGTVDRSTVSGQLYATYNFWGGTISNNISDYKMVAPLQVITTNAPTQAYQHPGDCPDIPSGLPWGGLVGQAGGSTNGTYFINTPNYGNVSLNAATIHAAQRMYPDSSADMDSAVTRFSEIIQYAYTTGGLSADNHRLLFQSYQFMMQALGHSVNNGQTTVVRGASVLPSSFQKVLNTQDSILAHIEDDTAFYTERFTVNLDKATTLRFAERRNDGMQVLDGMLAWAKPEDLETITYWNCIMTGEQMVLDTLIDIDALDSLYPCVLPADTSEEESALMAGAMKDLKTANKAQVQVYPNPTEGSIALSARNLSPGTISVRLTDMLGREVMSFSLKADDKGIMNESLQLSHLPKGIYFLRLDQQDNHCVEKIILK